VQLSNQQVTVAGATMTVKVEYKRNWYHVVFPFDMMVKVNPKMQHRGQFVRGNNRAVVYAAVEHLESLPVKKIVRALEFALSPATASSESIEWACAKMGGISKDEARRTVGIGE